MPKRSGWLELPEGWRREGTSGPWPFVTEEKLRRPDGSELRWTSRSHRKRVVTAVDGSTWWAPHARGWWIGVLFAVGALCFAIGSFPPYALGVGERADDVTYFVGSIFFTSAALLQYLEAASAARGLDGGGEGPPRWTWRVLTWAPWRIDWWSTTVQLVGTVLFNVSTLAAVQHGLDSTQLDRQVWMPDLWGSICFLVASSLAWAEAGHAWWSWRPRSSGWRIAAANMVGSIAFGVSAVAAYVVPESGDLVSEALANLGTFVGALCFLGGAVLLLPERVAGPATADD